MCPPPKNTHWVNYIPILETVFEETTIKRVLVFPVGHLEVAISTVICSLVGRDVEDDCIELNTERNYNKVLTQVSRRFSKWLLA